MHCLEFHSQFAIPSDHSSEKEGARGLTDPVGNKRTFSAVFPTPSGQGTFLFLCCVCSLVLMGDLKTGCYYFSCGSEINQERIVVEGSCHLLEWEGSLSTE